MKKRMLNIRKRLFYKLILKIFFIFLIVFGGICVFFQVMQSDNEKILNSDVQALKISSDTLFDLYELAQKYNICFTELLTYHLMENHFLENYAYDSDKIEQNLIFNYGTIKSNYEKEEVSVYYTIINNIFNDIKKFPIMDEYTDLYIYGDSWGFERSYGGKRIHMGCDVFDRENKRGRIPIISMTDGIIENIGWNEKGGYRVGVRSSSGNYYYYAHFNSYAGGIGINSEVKAGDMLGYMGDTGYSKVEGTMGNFPVHLHIGISVKTDLSDDEFWINPYPFLRLKEKLILKEN